MAEKQNVNTPSPKHKELESLRELPRDLVGGLERLRQPAVAVKYFPRNATEQPERLPIVGLVDPWLNRINAMRLKNMFKDAVDDLVGRAFAKEAQWDDGTPQRLVDLMEDVDGRGTNFHVFGMNVAGTSCSEGDDFVLVDFPNTTGMEGLTLDEWERLRLEPFWRRYSPADVIGWSHRKFGKEERLEHVRLRERRTVRDGDWQYSTELQVRVLYCGDERLPDGDERRWARWEVWRPADKDKPEEEWVRVALGSMKPQVEIPLVNFPFLLAAPFEARPPLLDLAHLTVAHCRKMSSLDNAQHAVGFPFLHWAGGQIDPATKKPVGLGPNRLMVSSDPQAHVEFVEPSGTAWASLRVELSAMEDAAREMASEPLSTQASGNLTATGEAIRSAKSSSRLEAAVLGWQDSFNRLLRFTAIYLGDVTPDADKGWGGVQLNRRFVPITKNIEAVKVAKDLNVMGRLSNESLFKAMQAAEIVGDGVTFEEEEERIAKDGPKAPEPGLADAVDAQDGVPPDPDADSTSDAPAEVPKK